MTDRYAPYYTLCDMILGLPKGKLNVVSYSPEWARMYSVEEKLLNDLVGNWLDDLQHVGSTALPFPSMVAKPIIDMAAFVSNFEKIESCIVALEEIDYHYRGEQGIAGRHLFAKGQNVITHHLHMMLPGCSNREKQIYFRDYLLSHPDQAEAYAKLKRNLYNVSGGDRKEYQAGKKTFINKILEKAKNLYE